MDGKFGIYTEKELKKLKFEDIIKIIILFLIFLSTNNKNKISTKIINIEVVWIDPKVNNNENKNYQNNFKSFDFVKLSCFEKIKYGINYLNNLKFVETIIITSGRVYPEFITIFKENINNLMICPRIIIFTREKQTFFNIYKDNKNLLINDPFYNPGSVQDTLQPVLNFIKKRKEHKFIQNIVQFELSSKDFNFEYIKEKEQLILPIYLPNYINQANESKIQKFNEYILNEYSNEESIVSLFDRLINIEKIPHEILSKYWIKTYTAETKFTKI